MAKYISVESTIDDLHTVDPKYQKMVDWCIRVIEAQPAADVAPVRHGRWVIYKAPDAYHCGLVKCPFCGEEMIAESDEYNFCPNCGAKMDGERDG